MKHQHRDRELLYRQDIIAIALCEAVWDSMTSVPQKLIDTKFGEEAQASPADSQQSGISFSPWKLVTPASKSFGLKETKKNVNFSKLINCFN